MPYEGHCLCGGCKIFVDAEPSSRGMGLCHCKDCQRSSGTAFAVAVPLPSEAVRVEGSVKEYAFKNPLSGNMARRWFCEGCGSHLTSQSSAHPERIAVKAGNIDAFTTLPIFMEIFTKDRWPGIPPVPGAEQREQSY